ncbi:MAG: HAD-IA family hydrolase [Pseudomonadota bacterium]
MLDLPKIRAITLDLDDTLWPVWPAIHRAEEELARWLRQHAPQTALLYAEPAGRHEAREKALARLPDLHHDLSAIRREAIRITMEQAGEDTALAQAAFEVFFHWRNEVELFEDARPALAFLASRFPVIALSNGNADIARIGLAEYFRGSVSAQSFGVGKPDRRIFEAGAQAAGVRVDEVLHVGDDAALDVVGALEAGMQTVWVNREDHLWTHGTEPHETVTSLSELVALLQGSAGSGA